MTASGYLRKTVIITVTANPVVYCEKVATGGGQF